MSPDLWFWLELVFKMAMTAAVVVFISIVVERSGPFIGALIAALPTAAGAAYVILAIEHPPAFIAASAVGSMAIGAAIAIFAAVYAMLAQRHGVVPSLGLSLLAWFCLRLFAAAIRLDAVECARAQRGGVRRDRSAELALPQFGAATEIPAHTVRHSAARARRRDRRRDRDQCELQHRFVRLRHVRPVPDRLLQLDRDFAPARRRHSHRKRHGACAGGAHRADAGLYGCALSRATARLVVGPCHRAWRLGGLERHAAAGAEEDAVNLIRSFISRNPDAGSPLSRR